MTATAPGRDVIGRAVLAITSLVVGAQGIRYLIDPEMVLASASVSTDSIDERSVLRAGYGGVLLAVGVIGLAGSALARLRAVGRGALLIVLVGLVAGRLVSLAVDGIPSTLLIRLLVIEGALIAANLATLIRRPRPR